MYNFCLIEQWVTAYKKVDDKRVALRKGVGILQEQIDRLQLDNANLKKGTFMFNLVFGKQFRSNCCQFRLFAVSY